MIRMPIGSGASRPHRTARDRRNGARNASESLPAIPRITQNDYWRTRTVAEAQVKVTFVLEV